MDLSLLVLCLCLFNGVFGEHSGDNPEADHSGDNPEMEHSKNNTEINYPEHNTEMNYAKNITEMTHSEDNTTTKLPEVYISNYFDIDLNNDSIPNGQNIKQIRVTEGDNVTLPGSASRMSGNYQVKWTFRPQNFNTGTGRNYSVEEFGDRLHADPRTGSLTIRNITSTDSGLYFQNSSMGVRTQIFSLTVRASSYPDHLPTPTVTGSTNCSSSSERSSSSKCVLWCSVVNLTDVSLSWYNGSQIHSSISVSDLNISLSLSTEDTNTYSCVVSNPVVNQTQHLNITQHCQPCSKPKQLHPLLALLAGVLGILFGMCYCCCDGERRRTILIFR